MGESLFPSAGGGLIYTAPPLSDAGKVPETPEESITDRIYFVFNNVSKSNAKEKSSELAELLGSEDRLLSWFAFYLVAKRVPVEQTFHELFAQVLDNIQERVPTVRYKVMAELIRSIKVRHDNACWGMKGRWSQSG